MKICPECKHVNSDYVDHCEKCLARLKSEKTIVKQEILATTIKQDVDYFPFTEIIGVLVILYEVFLAIYGLVAIHQLDFSVLVILFLGVAILSLSSEIKALRRQVTFLQNNAEMKKDLKIE